ncbi:MAG: squalene/phytoene synthase family protein [Planctomycetota bacterium]
MQKIAADQSLTTLLEGSSRTFALSIPLLPEPLRRQVTVAYLLFRIADTFEDETAWDTDTKLAGLTTVDAILAAGADNEGVDQIISMVNGTQLSQPGYTTLMRAPAVVFESYKHLDETARVAIASHLRRTISGMGEHLRREAPIATIDEVRQYCYYVAGIVGEMLTELFGIITPAIAGDAELRELAPRFGEALQLVNILRDSADDAKAGRFFVPSDAQRAALFELAEEDIALSRRYVQRLEALGAPAGAVAFNTLNLCLASSTIAAVRQCGPGAKVGRDAVQDLFATIVGAVDSGSSVASLAAAV